MQFHDRLKELRLSRHLSQVELSKRLGVAASTVSMWELGKRQPRFEDEETIADFFNVDLDYLRGGSDVTTKLVTGDAHLLLHIFRELDEASRELLLTYGRGLLDAKVMRDNEKGAQK